MTRPPTPTERDATAAWVAHQARVSQQAERALRVFLATVLGVLLALALVHWATPCADAALCLAPAAVPRAWLAGLRGRLRGMARRLHMAVLQARLQQLLGTAQAMALDARQPADAPLRLGAVLARAATVRLQLAALQQADRQDRVRRAAARAAARA